MMNLLKKIKENINILVDRWHSKMPSFWKKVLNICIILGTSAAGIIGADKYFDLQNSYGVSPIIFTISGYILAVCGGLGLGAKLTKE